jgi:hypothetical protein
LNAKEKEDEIKNANEETPLWIVPAALLALLCIGLPPDILLICLRAAS